MHWLCNMGGPIGININNFQASVWYRYFKVSKEINNLKSEAQLISAVKFWKNWPMCLARWYFFFSNLIIGIISEYILSYTQRMGGIAWIFIGQKT